MKNMALAAALSLIVLSSLPANAEPDPLPNSGTYFITNMGSDEALQPAGNTQGQYVLLFEYNKGGMQKWTINRKIDPKTQKPTNRYTIRLAGENDELNFQPHPIGSMTSILGAEKSVYVLESGETGTLIKSVDRNGDALYARPQPPMPAEGRFGPDDGSAKYRWKFTQAD